MRPARAEPNLNRLTTITALSGALLEDFEMTFDKREEDLEAAASDEAFDVGDVLADPLLSATLAALKHPDGPAAVPLNVEPLSAEELARMAQTLAEFTRAHPENEPPDEAEELNLEDFVPVVARLKGKKLRAVYRDDLRSRTLFADVRGQLFVPEDYELTRTFVVAGVPRPLTIAAGHSHFLRIEGLMLDEFTRLVEEAESRSAPEALIDGGEVVSAIADESRKVGTFKMAAAVDLPEQIDIARPVKPAYVDSRGIALYGDERTGELYLEESDAGANTHYRLGGRTYRLAADSRVSGYVRVNGLFWIDLLKKGEGRE